MDVVAAPTLSFEAAALHTVSGYAVLFVRSNAGEELACPASLEGEKSRRSVFGRKGAGDDGVLIVPPALLVSFLRSCAPVVPGLEHMRSSGSKLHLYNRAGVEALLGAKRLASFSWPDHSASGFVYKPPPPPPPPAPVVPDMDLLDMLASTALDALPVAGTRLCDGRAVQMPRRL